MRHEYEANGIDEAEFGPDPLVHFEAWLADAVAAEVPEPNALVVATVDADGQPWSRYVLLKEAGPDGFDFYTNYESNKSAQMTANPRASLTFGWLPLRRQVMVAGLVERVPAEVSDAYWSVRPRGSQLGGWASEQSRPLRDRAELEARYREAEATHGDEVARPAHWGGWRLRPHTIEFWQGRLNRLHDRLRYTRSLDPGAADGGDGRWSITRLAP